MENKFSILPPSLVSVFTVLIITVSPAFHLFSTPKKAPLHLYHTTTTRHLWKRKKEKKTIQHRFSLPLPPPLSLSLSLSLRIKRVVAPRRALVVYLCARACVHTHTHMHSAIARNRPRASAAVPCTSSEVWVRGGLAFVWVRRASERRVRVTRSRVRQLQPRLTAAAVLNASAPLMCSGKRERERERESSWAAARVSVWSRRLLRCCYCCSHSLAVIYYYYFFFRMSM